MGIDTEKFDQAVLALLLLGRHDDDRTGKSFDWEVMGRLHQKGYITDPVSKTKSVLFTPDGLRVGAAFRELFSKDRTVVAEIGQHRFTRDDAPASRTASCQARFARSNDLSSSDAQRSTGNDSGGTSNSMLRATLGLRRISPARSRVSTI